MSLCSNQAAEEAPRAVVGTLPTRFQNYVDCCPAKKQTTADQAVYQDVVEAVGAEVAEMAVETAEMAMEAEAELKV